jgi:hypothetical protein
MARDTLDVILLNSLGHYAAHLMGVTSSTWPGWWSLPGMPANPPMSTNVHQVTASSKSKQLSYLIDYRWLNQQWQVCQALSTSGQGADQETLDHSDWRVDIVQLNPRLYSKYSQFQDKTKLCTITAPLYQESLSKVLSN